MEREHNKSENPHFLIVGNSLIAQNLYEYLFEQNLTVDFLNDRQQTLADKKYDFVVISVKDCLEEKADWLYAIKNHIGVDGSVAINLDGLNLEEIQQKTGIDVLGLNFSYPLMASPFMEIVRTERNSAEQVANLQRIGIEYWLKDPYITYGVSARAFLLAAMTRETLYLVDNGYATVDSIDRACRNDAGYYLPFIGNFLYMDLMGTLAYALVMKDLNTELSNAKKLPDWFAEKVNTGKSGMQDMEGFYTYTAADYKAWTKLINEFSLDIKEIIDKYQKDYKTIEL